MSERTDLACGCAWMRIGGQTPDTRRWWQVVACPNHEMDMRPYDKPGPSADRAKDFPQLLRRAGTAIRLCFEPATREHLEDYVEDFTDDDLDKLCKAADELHGATLQALIRRHG